MLHFRVPIWVHLNSQTPCSKLCDAGNQGRCRSVHNARLYRNEPGGHDDTKRTPHPLMPGCDAVAPTQPGSVSQAVVGCTHGRAT